MGDFFQSQTCKMVTFHGTFMGILASAGCCGNQLPNGDISHGRSLWHIVGYIYIYILTYNCMQCNVMQCNVMQCNVMYCNVMQYNVSVYVYDNDLIRSTCSPILWDSNHSFTKHVMVLFHGIRWDVDNQHDDVWICLTAGTTSKFNCHGMLKDETAALWV